MVSAFDAQLSTAIALADRKLCRWTLPKANPVAGTQLARSVALVGGASASARRLARARRRRAQAPPALLHSTSTARRPQAREQTGLPRARCAAGTRRRRTTRRPPARGRPRRAARAPRRARGRGGTARAAWHGLAIDGTALSMATTSAGSTLRTMSTCSPRRAAARRG